jgi:hypothetical protein
MEEIYESRMEIPEVQSEVIIDETESRELPMQGELNDFDLD